MTDEQKDETPAAPVDGAADLPTPPASPVDGAAGQPEDTPITAPLEDDEIEVHEDDGDPSVPSELLELHVELEEKGVSTDAFKEAYGESQEGGAA